MKKSHTGKRVTFASEPRHTYKHTFCAPSLALQR